MRDHYVCLPDGPSRVLCIPHRGEVRICALGEALENDICANLWRVCVGMFTLCMCACVYVCMCVCVYVCMCVCAYVHVCACVCCDETTETGLLGTLISTRGSISNTVLASVMSALSIVSKSHTLNVCVCMCVCMCQNRATTHTVMALTLTKPSIPAEISSPSTRYRASTVPCPQEGEEGSMGSGGVEEGEVRLGSVGWGGGYHTTQTNSHCGTTSFLSCLFPP